MRDQDLTQHLRRDFAHFRRRLANMDSAFESICERALATPAGVNLRFNNDVNIAKFARDLLRFVKRSTQPSLAVVATSNFCNSSLAWYS